MAKLQSKPVPDDVVVQLNFEELFEDAHTHPIRTTIPTAAEGNVGDIILYETSTVTKIYVKFRGGWKSVSLA